MMSQPVRELIGSRVLAIWDDYEATQDPRLAPSMPIVASLMEELVGEGVLAGNAVLDEDQVFFLDVTLETGMEVIRDFLNDDDFQDPQSQASLMERFNLHAQARRELTFRVV